MKPGIPIFASGECTLYSMNEKQRIMADRGPTSGKLPTSTMSTRKRKKLESDTKRGFTRISIGDRIDHWLGFSVTYRCVVFTVRGGDLLGTRLPDKYVFKNSCCPYSLFIQHFAIRKLISQLFKGYYMSYRP